MAREIEWESKAMEPKPRIRFKLEKGKDKRIRLVGRTARTLRHYYPGVGYWEARSAEAQNSEGELYVHERGWDAELLGKDPAPAYCSVVVVFDTDRDGKPTGGFELNLWTFGEGTKDKIHAIRKQWDLDGHDLIVTTKREKFQDLEATPANDTAYTGDNKSRIDNRYDTYPFRDVCRELESAIGDDDLRAKLTAAMSGSAEPKTGSVKDTVNS